MIKLENKNMYPVEFENYLKDNDISIKQIPDKYRIIKEDLLPNKKIKSMKVLMDYLGKEKEFWDYREIYNNNIVSSYRDIYSKALSDLTNTINMSSTNIQQALINFKNVINYILVNCDLSSRTKLATLMKKYKDKNNFFFYGFYHALVPNERPSYIQNQNWHEGYFYGMQYIKAINSIEEYVRTNHSTYCDAVKMAETELSKVVEGYTTAYNQQEEKIKIFWQTNEEALNNQRNEIEKFIEIKEQRLINLEKVYEDKLKLSKPADYWNKLSRKYGINGSIWLFFSFIIAISTILGLVFFMLKNPNIFDGNDDLYLIIKNTALLTVITSIAIYVLRITVKMTLSSFHLSRDSKEREQLAYFYLSLMETKAVSDKERVIILNALFSRSDTGLLKGDSSPVMTANVTDIVDRLKSE